MKWFVAVTIVALVLMPAIASGQDATPTPSATASEQFQLPDPGDILPLHRGQASPQDGLLIGAADLLNIQQSYERMRFLLGLTQERDAQVCDVRIQIEHAHTLAAEERLTLRDTLWTDRQAELVAQVQAAQAQAQHAGERQWFESPVMWLVVGALVATVAFVAVTVR